jgi:hypothetical protein
MRVALAACALAAAWPLPAAGKGGAACSVHGRWSFPRLANLPRGALAALGFAMAERGAPFEATDDVSYGSRLPSARFIAASQRDCRLVIRYEQGGIAHFNTSATLAWTGRAWVRIDAGR